MNWLVFDRDYNLILSKSNFDRLSGTAKEIGQDVAHELLNSPEITIDVAGYVYIFLSNEETTPFDVYFDDFKVTHVKSPVVQMDDYYPFGLTFNSYQRENSLENRIKFQAQERISDLGLNWDSFKYRNYLPEVGRFFCIDPLASQYVYNSPFAFAENKLGRGIELEGRELMSFLTGAFNTIVTNHHPTQAGKGLGRESATDQGAYDAGAKAGNLVSLVVGAYEMYLGGTTTVVATAAAPESGGATLVVAAEAAAVAVTGTVVIKNAFGNLLKSGSYTNTHESGKRYHGKGPPERARESAKRVEKENDDPIKDTDWTPAENNDEAFKQEAQRIRDDGGVENPENYNKINSPGEKKLQAEEQQTTTTGTR